ncbi:MAG TPA: hypothetical protein VF807_02835 [Ktedonobacterales bacterium]
MTPAPRPPAHQDAATHAASAALEEARTRRLSGLAYLPVAGFVLLVTERSRWRVRFHAAQASTLYLLWTLIAVSQPVLTYALAKLMSHSTSQGAISAVNGAQAMTGCISGLLYLSIIVTLALGATLATRGHAFRIPGVAWLARRMVSLVPVAKG